MATKRSANFEASPETLAWLVSFAITRTFDVHTSNHVEDLYPWLWNPSWGESFSDSFEGVKAVKAALRRTESIVQSLESFLGVAKNRLECLRKTLKSATLKAYFPLLPDEILRLIFRFASSRNDAGKPDYKSPCRFSQVSRRFRDLALRDPTLWRFLDSERQSLGDVQLLTQRSTIGPPILEVRLSCDDDFSRSTRKFIERVHAHILYLRHIRPLSQQLVSLHFEYSFFYHKDVLVELTKSYKHLKLPSLQELRIDFSDAAKEDQGGVPEVHFYRSWALPSLTTLKSSNLIPKLHRDVLAALTECSLSLRSGRGYVFNGRWDLSKAMAFLSLLTKVKDLKINLRGDQIHAVPNTLPKVSLSSVERLTTSFINVNSEVATEFCRAFDAPSKSAWAVEIKDLPAWPLAEQLKVIFYAQIGQGFKLDPVALNAFANANAVKDRARTPRSALKEVHLTIHRESGRSDCHEVMEIVPAYNVIKQGDTLENLTVTYPDDGQGFLGPKSPLRVDKIELKNCKKIVKDVLHRLEERFSNAPRNSFSRLTIDGSKAENSDIDELVLNASIVQD